MAIRSEMKEFPTFGLSARTELARSDLGRAKKELLKLGRNVLKIEFRYRLEELDE
jgi:hypothetical protein